ncbi:fluoride efflux transporter FluC [Pediococcus siamensis]|uniref:fluoride efflux transporter FluC n=1 Tax=Pediococcus siamensis TaxID=381829 RepID=UPI00399FDD40
MDELIIGLFAFLGGCLRYGIDFGIPNVQGLPVATLLINILGSFLLALLNTTWTVNEHIPARLSLGLGTGMIGAFTTFSSFSLEIVALLASGHYLLAGGYAILSLSTGLFGALLGFLLGKKLYPKGDIVHDDD